MSTILLWGIVLLLAMILDTLRAIHRTMKGLP